jgi:hypothetical protein
MGWRSAKVLAFVMVAGMVLLVPPGCGNDDGGSSLQADVPAHEPAVASADAPTADAPKASAPLPASTADPSALAELHRFQRANVEFAASVMQRFAETGQEAETYADELSAHFGSSPALPTGGKERLQVTWDGAKFSLAGKYVPTLAEEEDTRQQAREIVSITGEVDPSCLKILWLKCTREQVNVVEGTGKVKWSRERKSLLALEAGALPRLSASAERGWVYGIEAEAMAGLRKIQFSKTYISKSADPRAEGRLTTERTESTTTGDLPKFGTLKVAFFRASQ